ncbi:MAG TPA: hypothetical protein VFX15_00420 [Actinomycetes bacterium]|nr:hypothetical protein [Actinomycetes bacterium]
MRHEGIVSEDPADFTPNIVPDSTVDDPAVHALGNRRGTIYAGGTFRTVQTADNSQSFIRHNIVAFDAQDGMVRDFAPRVNGTVWAVQPHGNSIFLGGEFTKVNGARRHAIVKVDAITGQVRKEFRSPFASGIVRELRMARGRLIVGGSVPGKLRALNPDTGKVTRYLHLRIRGQVADNAGPTNVYRFAVSPDRTRLVAVGNFTSVNRKTRYRAFMVSLRKRSTVLNEWRYQPFRHKCKARIIPAYLRDVDFSPSGRYFVVAASGYIPRPGRLGVDVCDAAARFETNVKNPKKPTWINYTGGDTLHSVAVTGAAVYVQGHQRWLDNPLGQNDAGPGAVSREGIGAIDPRSGKALEWNPGKTRGIGGKDMLATPAGLWVGSDGALFAGEFRSRIAFCPI